MNRRIGVLGLVVGVLLALCASTAVAAGDDGVVPGRSDLPGYRAAGTGAALARAAVDGALTSSLRHAPAVGAGFRSGGRTITFGVITASSTGQAAAALKALRHGRRSVALGTGIGGLLRDRSRQHQTDVAVVFAVGRELGAVRLRASAAVPTAHATVVAQAQSLLQRIRRVGALTPLDHVLEGIRPDGSFSAQVALQAFALAYGPLPGVPGTPGPTGAALHATMAIGMVLRVWNQLSAAQQAAIDDDLGFTAPPLTGALAPMDRTAVQTLTFDPAYTAIADTVDAKYHALIPGVPPITIKVYRAAEKIVSPEFGDAAADAAPVDQNGNLITSGPMTTCQIRVPPAGQTYTGNDLTVLLAHETFHCIEFALNPTGWPKLGNWEIEGLADWAAQSTNPPSPFDNSLQDYFGSAEKPLFSRAYDATGFWGHADEVGGKGSLWAKLPTILNAPSYDDAYSEAGGGDQAFQDTWPSALWRSAAGPAWRQTDPVYLPTKGVGTDAIIVDDDSGLHSDPYALGEYAIEADPERPLVQVISTLGTMRAGTATQDFGTAGISDFYCSGDCTCPNGEQSSIPDHQNFSKMLRLALTGGDGVGIGAVKYHSLDDFCAPSPSNGLQIYHGMKVLAQFKSGTCSVSGGGFHATAHDGAWSIDVRIKAFSNYSKRYELTHSNDPVFVVSGPGGPYSNRYPSPHQTPATGAITFYPGGTKMLLGYEYAWNAGGSDAILPIGKMTCVKPKKH
jgi:hypothetical protein